MNYRHAYHAGNFADCFKHALLIALLDSLARKPTPYFVLDTHAGAGWYDLDAEPALRTGEASAGIRRLLQSASPSLSRYIELVTRVGLYPGSPALIRAMLRDGDRMACCELHPEDSVLLRRRFRGDPQVAVHTRCGWEALGALLPPMQKRGLVFIDPPFEAADEFSVLMDGLRRGYARFRNATFAAWYPIKQLAAVRTFQASLRETGLQDIIAVELHLRDPSIAYRLNGCGLVVINPPYQFEDEANQIACSILDSVGDQEAGSGAGVIRLADE